jgi:zinc/manganese transport system substrate-binding protein
MNYRRRFLLTCSLALSISIPLAASAAEPIAVAASFSILGDLVGVVGGQRVAVTALVGPDEDAHTFEPRPTDAKTILNAKLLVTNGLGFEPWAGKLAKAAGYKGDTVVASAGVKGLTLPTAKSNDKQKDHSGHSHGAMDPHAWQNPDNVAVYVRNIAAGLTRVDPAGAATYQTNADAYIKELQALDTWAQAQFAGLAPAQRKVITSHDAFGYLGARYKIQFLAPQGVNTDAEPSAKQVGQLIRQIQREKIRAVFVENMSDPRLMAQLSRDAGVTVGAALYSDALSRAGQPGATYLQMMRHNVGQIAAGMKLN